MVCSMPPLYCTLSTLCDRSKCVQCYMPMTMANHLVGGTVGTTTHVRYDAQPWCSALVAVPKWHTFRPFEISWGAKTGHYGKKG